MVVLEIQVISSVNHFVLWVVAAVGLVALLLEDTEGTDHTDAVEEEVAAVRPEVMVAEVEMDW